MKNYFLIFYLIIFSSVCKSQNTTQAILEIDTTEIVQIGKIQQFLSFKGSDRSNPILLILHGGPGKSLNQFSKGFTNKLNDNFIVVNWDQRETGETLKLNRSKDSLNVKLMQDDSLEIISYLLKKFNKKKLYLLSHSWGSVMGFEIASKHPEILHAYIPISPVVDANNSAILTINQLKKWAEKNKNNQATEELDRIKLPFQDKNDFFLAQKWLFIHNEVEGAETTEFKTVYYEWMNIWFPIWKENAQTSLFKTISKIDCPIYFFVGRMDNQTYYSITEKYFKFLHAKKKKLFWFNNSGHTIFNTEPEKLQDLIIKLKNTTK